MEGCSVTLLTAGFALHGANHSSAGLVLRMNDFFDRLISDRGLLTGRQIIPRDYC